MQTAEEEREESGKRKDQQGTEGQNKDGKGRDRAERQRGSGDRMMMRTSLSFERTTFKGSEGN